MKITKNFIADLQRMKNEITRLLSETNTFRQGNRTHRTIPKLAGFQKFLRVYLSMSSDQQLAFAPELKRRMIRQQIVFGWMGIQMVSIVSLFSRTFQRMNDVPGDRSVPLTSKLSCVGRR